MENVRRHATNLLNLQQQKLIKLARTKRRRNYLVSEPNYHATKFFTKIISNRNEKNSNINE